MDVIEQAENLRLNAETYHRRAVNWNAAFTMWLKKSMPAPEETRPKKQFVAEEEAG